MTTTEQIELSMFELEALTGIPAVSVAENDWDITTHPYGYERPTLNLDRTWGPLRFCPAIIHRQASTFVGTAAETLLLRGTSAGDPTADAIGVYVYVLTLLVIFEAAAACDHDVDDTEGRRLAAEAQVWEVAQPDLLFAKRVQARANLRVVTA